MQDVVPDGIEPPAPSASAGRSSPFSWARRGAAVLVLVLLVEYVVLPQLVGLRAALDLLGRVSPLVLLVALVLEAASLLSYTALTRSVLGPGRSISFWTSLRIDLTGLGVSHVVPGGGATAAALRLRLMSHAGISTGAAVTTTVIQTAVGVCSLVALFAGGVALSLGGQGGNPVFVTAGVIALVLVLVIAAVLVALLYRPDATRAFLRRVVLKVPRLRADTVDGLVVGFANQVRTLAGDRSRGTRILVWAFGNWLFDAACLWTCLRAFGWTMGVGPLLAVYGLVNLVALLPITPGGLGVVEGILVPALMSFGSPHAIALIGVLTWRLVEFWLPIPLSWATYLSLRTGIFHDRDLARRLVPVGGGTR